ncbi:phospholipase D/nuclease [Trichoderma ceciliae]
MAWPNRHIPELADDADDDEALRYAIALSLQDQDPSAAAIVIDDSEEEDDEDGNGDDDNDDNLPASSSKSTQQSQPQPQSQFGSLLLDRKAMEEERLKRLSKRQRPSTDDDDDDDDLVEIPPPKKVARVSASESKAVSPISTPSSSSANSSLPFPNGTVKRTWARGCARTGEEITIEEVFQKDQLELAVLSSFQWDEEWMVSKLDITRTRILLLAFARDEAQKSVMRANVPANIKFCFPPMHGIGAMHSKLQLLKYPNRLRVVIPTGNLVPYDWGETGVMENMVFLIDLPRLETPPTHSRGPTGFYRELVYFLQATGMGEKMVASLSNYDFSKTSDIAFVHSIPGSHTGKTVERIGYCGLAASIAALGLASSDPVEVDLVCASLGAIKRELVEAIYNACRGDGGIDDEHNKAGGAGSRPAKRPAGTTPKELQERFRIYFPTDHTVSRSRGGRNAGGTICVQAKWWRSAGFPRELVRDVITRDRVLMHSKMIFVRRVGDSQAIRQRPGWAYVGSANLSESAWGRLSKDKSTGGIKMNCRNWECGVIIPVPESKTVDKTATGVGMAMFAGTVPVPMQVPGPVYGSNDQPWLHPGA